MIRKLEPIVGEWYRDHGEQRVFEVVAMDDDEGRINIQYADGDLLELSHDSWQDLLLSMAPPPEDNRSASNAAREMDGSESEELPSNDWHDNHEEFDLDDY